MTGAELLWMVAAMALAAAFAMLAASRRRARRELARLQAERAATLLGGSWRCSCGRQRMDRRTVWADGRGMLHGPAGCVPDLDALSDA